MKTTDQKPLTLAKVCQQTTCAFNGDFAEYDVGAASRLHDKIVTFYQLVLDTETNRDVLAHMHIILCEISAEVLRGNFQVGIVFEKDTNPIRQKLRAQLRKAGFACYVSGHLSAINGQTGYHTFVWW